ncbi:MAG: type III-B CRISPR-associated protein Cas10/Cmr2 [Mastigocoleus sp.]
MNSISKKNDLEIKIGIAWCLAWGQGKEADERELLKQTRQALIEDRELPQKFNSIIKEIEELYSLEFPQTLDELKELTQKYPKLWNSKIGLVYGGVTKVKQYVFEAAKLTDIRGASALLDRINLVDLPAFFGKGDKSITIENWLEEEDNFPDLKKALIPELIVYSTGGNILAFCPTAFVDDLANAIEKRYTHETLTANSCAVGDAFKLLEIRFGLLRDNIEETFWLDKYRDNYQHHLIEAYFGKVKANDDTLEKSIAETFYKRKSFNELTTKLAVQFNQRRSGNYTHKRLTRRYPPMFETHPYLRRDENDQRSAIARVNSFPNSPHISESLIRKRIVGQIAKREAFQERLPQWFKNINLEWQPTGIKIKSWVAEFEDFLGSEKNRELREKYYINNDSAKEALSLRELGNAGKGFVAYIYADGNNMGGYIRNIKIPAEYQKFSRDIFEATEKSVYIALAKHLNPHQLKNLTDPDNKNRNGTWIHPFEIITIGGDDVFLIVPADKALLIAKTIGEEFEKLLIGEGYRTKDKYNPELIHRYQPQNISGSGQCELSMSTGVLITAEETPIYYAEKLTNQLLKSAKKKAKDLKKDNNKYYGGTVDFLSLKSVTMISSDIKEFRNQGLTKFGTKGIKLKLYGAPYTLHELGGFLNTAKALKESKFPRSQIYQIRSLLERGKHTTILNYRYFRVRLDEKKQELLRIHFEEAWCKPKDENNKGNLAPWMSLKEKDEEQEEQEKQQEGSNKKKKTTYETIWREIVDIYPFIQDEEVDQDEEKTEISEQKVNQR